MDPLQSEMGQRQLLLFEAGGSTDADARTIRHLFKAALDARTPAELIPFIKFCQSFRRLSVWNARMAQIQRPGASVIASEYEWLQKGRTVAPDAVPIIILWPFGPIRFVYELEDTLPKIERASIGDPFMAEGVLKPGTVERLRKNLTQQKTFRIQVDYRRVGHSAAGSAAAHGSVPDAHNGPVVTVGDEEGIAGFAKARASSTTGKPSKIPLWRVKINERMTEAEQFVTVAHELGHIFCGHLGPCEGQRGREQESGWPDRRHIGDAQAELEAEAVAYLVTNRAELVTGSAQYLQTYATQGKVEQVDIDLVIRAAARIERLGKVHYGLMEFGPKPQTAETS